MLKITDAENNTTDSGSSSSSTF